MVPWRAAANRQPQPPMSIRRKREAEM